jgi:glyoxylase-like metal-dependent hydrolase (beta-lactamase superfamily II)
MDFVSLNSETKVLPGAVNMGVVSTSEGLVAVDTGLDRQSAKRILRVSESLGQPLIAIVNTHAHADHFGGNHALLAKHPHVRVFAPVDEAAIIRQPMFEPQYLWQGAQPFSGLKNKFLLAEASRVDVEFGSDDTWIIGQTEFRSILLPGHAHGQCGIVVNDVLFAADSYFGVSITDKHGIPYMVDYKQTLQSAKAVQQVSVSWWVPGHGEATNDPAADVHHLCVRHEQAFAEVVRYVQTASGVTLDELTGAICREFKVTPNNPSAWLLVRTTVAAYVSAAVESRDIELSVLDGVLRLTASNSNHFESADADKQV